ncbi:RHS repeat-associated core domain-containing protein [Streptomyces sp. NPDC046374]|uniref:RHS repeat-associated core domain-containing protein n=1 Tax=Streptomyces sp. NPDC046374 TaxID=3154917 RepID=UPI0033C9032F
MGVRLYAPNAGRFLSVDPVYGGNANSYEYAHADPVNNFDLDGRRCWNPFSETCRNKNNTVSFLYSAGSVCFSWCPYLGAAGRTYKAYRNGKRAWHYGRAAWRTYKRGGVRGLWNHTRSWSRRQGCVANNGGRWGCVWAAAGGATGVTEGWGHFKNGFKLGVGKIRAIWKGKWWR